MTTIAYRAGVLAADSLVTSNNLRDGHVQKIRRFGPLLVAAAGSASLGHQFFDWVGAGIKGPSPFQGVEGGGNGFIVMPDDLIVVWGTKGPWTLRAPFWACGSGQDLALGAMRAGCSADVAVLAAIDHDIYSGAPVHVLRR